MTTSTSDDSALIAAYRTGDDRALVALIERHQSKVYRLALGVLSSPHEAEDAAQEAMIAMFSSLARFRGESAFSTWLYRLTLNTCLKRRRSLARREDPLRDTADALPDASAVRPDALAGRSWLRDRIAGFLAALPDTYRLPVILSDAVGLPASEIAQIMGLSLPAVKARILRGRDQMRTEIERYCRQAGLSGWQELLP